ncbi:hypothetical protein [Clostridium sp. D53t1_180928_C8]|uniref:hypothetical protein n=1 Tax=Clostridium sp. D53t1_180928_C8 TaxID=2787101 RepID=UPI0018A9A912|nr:hypothetical protein [Clostridium sp. D53t1_180928_C8]
MRKVCITLVLLLTFLALVGCNVGTSQDKSKSNYNEISERVISQYLDSLSKKDINGLKMYSTIEWGNGFSQSIISELNETLESAKLLKYTIRESKPDRIIVDAEVEVICYENSIATGDWQPGKSISGKSFELINEDNEWKVNGWGAY